MTQHTATPPLGSSGRYWDERLRKHWSLAGVGYLGYGPHYNRWLYKLRAHLFAKHVAALCEPARDVDVIDIGSGTGFYVDLWLACGVRAVTASDISPFAVEQLRTTHHGLNVRLFDVGEERAAPETADQQFDIVSAFDVLFHIVDDRKYQQALSNISKLCSTGGYFVFSENLPRHRTIRTEQQANRRLDTVLKLLEANGFQLVRRIPLFVLMNTPVDTRRKWPLFAWRLLMAPVRLVPRLGAVYGPLLFWIDRWLTGVVSEGPSTELIICRKQ